MNDTKFIEVNGRRIGDGYPAYIIAEMSGNHAGSIEHAKEIIHAAEQQCFEGFTQDEKDGFLKQFARIAKNLETF